MYGYYEFPAGLYLIEESDGAVVRIEHVDERNGAGQRSTLTDKAADEIREYFDGKRKCYTIPVRLEGSPFSIEVWKTVMKVPYGATVTYGELAGMISRPGACRAVGSALGRNALEIVVPCHRVVPAGGGIGNYKAGPDIKRMLLELEQKEKT